MENFKNNDAKEAKSTLPSELTQNIKEILSSDHQDGKKIDSDAPIKEQQLTPLSDETKEKLKEKGYDQEIIDNIKSEEEAKIYQDAELESKDVNDKPALTRTDIDYDQKDELGRTNLERMEQGLAPLDKDGRPYELHHIGQGKDSPLAELTHKEHREGGNDTILHDKQKESEIDRTAFNKERAEHWKARAEQVKQQQSGV